MAPADVEGAYQDYKLTRRHLQAWPGRKALVEAMKTTSCRETNRVNHRWGLVLLGKGGKRLGAIYLGEDGDSGTVDARSVKFSGPLGRVVFSEFGGTRR